MSDAKFESIVQDYFSRLMRMEPVYATYLGVHEYDGMLPRGTKSHFMEKIALLKEFKDNLAEIEPEKLSREKRIDWMLARHIAKIELFKLEELRFWERMSPVPDIVG